jgi:hypothetical protein
MSRGGPELVEDYAERVQQAAGYLTRLLGDTGTRIDSPVDEPLGPDGERPVDLADVALGPTGFDPGDGITMTAIDGGSACLVNGRSFWVVAFRAGWVRHRDRVTFEEQVDPLDLRTLTVTDAKAAYAEALAKAGAVRERELADLGGIVNVLRDLAEWDKVIRAIEVSDPGDVVFVDGSLHPGPFLPERFVGPIHQLALERQVDLVGVTKASKLRWGRYAPLVLRIRRLAEDRGFGDRRWHCRITEIEPVQTTASEVYVARLAPRGSYAFRVDAVRGARSAAALCALRAGASDAPAFLGYPYPLARVHQIVSLPGYLLADLRRDLREHLLRTGVNEDDADLVLRDFHLTLNA